MPNLLRPSRHPHPKPVRRPLRDSLLLLSAILPLIAGSAFSQSPSQRHDPALPVLTTAREVARYPHSDPSRQPPVLLEAVITFLDPNGTIFVRDETGATFFRSRPGNHYQPGQVVSLKGTRFPGLYIGGIVPSGITVKSVGPPPEPRLLTLRDLSTGHHHYEFIEVEGIGRTVEPTGETTATLRLNVEGGILEVQFDQAPENSDSLIDARLRIRGLAAGAINDHRELVYPYLRAAGSSAVTIIEPQPATPFDIQDIPISNLYDQARSGPSHRVKISGTALSPPLHGSIFIRSGDRNVRILTRQAPHLKPGDTVEALGFPQMGAFSAVLSDAIVRTKSGGTALPTPAKPGQRQFNSGAHDAGLVTLDGTVLQHLENDNTLILRTPFQTLRVTASGWPLPKLSPGTQIRCTGIWLVTSTRHGNYRATPTASELWLRAPADITVLSAPSWWNVEKLSITLGIVAGAALLTLVWAAMLQRQVSRQVKVIEAKAQREAMIEERQRIAREFHDTLEQELAGLSLRLDAATTRVTDDKARTLLDQLRHLLFRLQNETRDFVWDLRDESQIAAPLATSLDRLVDHLQTTTPIPLEFSAAPGLPPLSGLACHHLLRLAREAIHNAIKYSGATHIRIGLTHAPGTVTLKIEDNGTGFDLAERSNAPGHFGLQGMKERVRKLGATLDLRSAPGQGTCVEVRLATGGTP